MGARRGGVAGSLTDIRARSRHRRQFRQQPFAVSDHHHLERVGDATVTCKAIPAISATRSTPDSRRQRVRTVTPFIQDNMVLPSSPAPWRQLRRERSIMQAAREKGFLTARWQVGRSASMI